MLSAVLLGAPPPTLAQQALDAALRAEHASLKAPAISIAVADKGRIVYAKAFGQSDVENSVAATAETRFRTASIAKPLTATAVLQLFERGLLDLDAPIQNYCSQFPAKPWPVTTRHILGHVAGIRHYTKPGESSGSEHFFSIADSLKLFAGDPLLFEPGTKYSYSTYGYSVLGCAIEGVSKLSYGDYMRAHVFGPAGMTRTSLDDVYLVVPNRSRGYFLLDQRSFDRLPPTGKAIATVGGIYNASLHDTSMKIPGGGLLSTPSDLVAFAMALLDGKLLKPDTLKMMWTAQTTRDGKSTEYGLGWGISSNPDRLIVSHVGNQAGASSTFMIDVPTRRALAIMANLEDADLGGVRKVLTGPLSPATRSQREGEPYTLRTAKGPERATLHWIDVPENRATPQRARIDGPQLRFERVR